MMCPDIADGACTIAPLPRRARPSAARTTVMKIDGFLVNETVDWMMTMIWQNHQKKD